MSDGLRLARWKSEAGRAAFFAAYDEALALWPVPYESHFIKTRFGETHALVSGDAAAPPLILLPAATGAGALQWFPNAKRLADHRRVYAIDILGAPGKGTQTRAITDAADYVGWFADLLDELGVDRADLVGSSQGGWATLNFVLARPERARRVALLGPAASLLPFRPPVLLSIRIGPYMPAWTAGPTMRSTFGGRYRVDDRIIKVMEEALRHFRYQQRAVHPFKFSDEALRQVRAEVLVMIGDQEMIYDPKAALDRAAELIPGVETELVPAAGHLLGMEQPDVVDDRLLAFLEDRPAGDDGEGSDRASGTPSPD